MKIKDIFSFCKQIGLSEQAIKEIEFIRNSEPSRRVRSGIRNVAGFYPSKKMGVTIQFESRTVELPAIYEKEHDPLVFEYYDQPPSFPIKYQINGKNHGHLYTPDFFVISEEFIGWEEWKTEEELIKLSIKHPHRYCLNEDGNWKCPPAEEYAKSKGLSFRIRLSKEIDWTYQRNIRFLEEYLLTENLRVSDHIKTIVQDRVKNCPGITLSELLDNEENYNADDIYTLIASDELYIDFSDQPIPEMDLVKVYIDWQTAEAYKNIVQSHAKERFEPSIIEMIIGTKVQWDGRQWTIINIGEKKISLLNDDTAIEIPNETFGDFVVAGKIKGLNINKNEIEQEALNILKTAGEEELRKANKKYMYINKILNGEDYDSIPVSNRTLRFWMKNYKEAEELYGNGYIGLITKKHRQGNRNKKLPEETITLMEEYIKNEYETITQKTKTTVYKMFVVACKEKGYPYPSFKTFCKEIANQTEYELTKKRKGRKAAYKNEPFYWYLEQTTPRHGDRPFEIAHMDHTQLDVELVCSATGKILGRPWVTFMMDAYSRRILSAFLTFDEPSYRSSMMTLRGCVKRYSRLPKILVVDGGKEFSSTYFETFLAYYKVQKQERPASKARFGSVCERLFGTTNKVFIHNLTGNTQLMTNVRQVSKEVNPKRHAVWTLPLLSKYLYKFVYEIYDTMEHSALGECPRDTYQNGTARTGKREFTFIGYDDTFKMLTLPTTKKGYAKVQAGRGVKINRFYYWSDDLYNPEVEGKQVEVRYDPFNIAVAYAYIKNRWVQLHSEYKIFMMNRTEKEVQIAFDELRKRQQVQGKITTLTTKKLVEFLRSVQDVEKLQLQRLRDQEMRATLNVIEGGKGKKKEEQLKSSKSSSNNFHPLQDGVTKKKKDRTIFGEF
ncbi:DDE-type integrase/transposase/recombinase [Caldifermentibacillus hisashii]|uniref:TnsA endonuclease N-terminal domain-containing protein n=1 Tax=Bacillaceae TaxID=186817 RepID=UPI002E1A54A1|nr:DDE-type integrase/transposase/recombinase [Caldifermentibacillus hisashii]